MDQKLLSVTQRGHTHEFRKFVVVHCWYKSSWVATGNLDPLHAHTLLMRLLLFAFVFIPCQPCSRDCFARNRFDVENGSVSYVKLHVSDLWYHTTAARPQLVWGSLSLVPRLAHTGTKSWAMAWERG